MMVAVVSSSRAECGSPRYALHRRPTGWSLSCPTSSTPERLEQVQT